MIARLALLLSGLLLSYVPAYALDSCVVPHGAARNIDEHTVCRRIINNHASGLSVMVPTKSATEWSTGGGALLNALPAGVTAAACACGGANWGSASQSPTYNNPTPASMSKFSTSMEMEGNNLIIGASGAGGNGKLYIVNASTGALVRTVNAPSADNSEFADSVALSGNLAAAGDHEWSSATLDEVGRAYVVNINTGAITRTISNPTASEECHFGRSVDIDGTNLIVGSPKNDTGATNSGQAYIFNASTGALLRTLNNPTVAANDYFGHAVAIEGNLAAVGAYGDDVGASNGGVVHIFNVSTGGLVVTIANPHPAADDSFGSELAMQGGRLIVGVMEDDQGAVNAGRAYVFNASTGALVRAFNNPSPAVDDDFGVGVDIEDNIAAVGAWGDDAGADGAGRAYIYNISTGALLRTLSNPTPTTANPEYFGQSVTLSGSRLAVGTLYDNQGVARAGRAYGYSAPAGACSSCSP